jgi:hypothetical protein
MIRNPRGRFPPSNLRDSLSGEIQPCCRQHIIKAWLLKMNGEKIIRIGRMIYIPDNAPDTSLLCLPVQANGADDFKLALYLISRGLKGVDARIVHTLHDEIVVDA